MGAGASCKSSDANEGTGDSTDTKNEQVGGVTPQGQCTFASLADINADAFELGKTKRSQELVLNALFSDDKENSYKFAGTMEQLVSFLGEIREGYLNANFPGAFKSYHTFAHALDVMLTCHCMLETGLGKFFLKEEERTALILAAISHDVLHPGLSNPYFAATKHEVALKYNNDAILERQSIDYTIPRCEKYELFSSKDASEFIRTTILYTDMARHKAIMEKMEELHPYFMESLNKQREIKGLEKLDGVGYTRKDHDAGIDLSEVLSEESRQMLGALLLHSADVSNPVKQFSYCERWAGLVMSEFFGQGDLEKKNGLPVSMNCDRDTVSTPKCQIGFGSFVIQGLYALLAKFLPEISKQYLKNLDSNTEIWRKFSEAEDNDEEKYKIKLELPSTENGGISLGM